MKMNENYTHTISEEEAQERFLTKINNPLFSSLQTLTNGLNDIVVNVGKYISDGAISIINVSVGFLTNVFLCITAAVYFLIDMDKIRKKVRDFFKKRTSVKKVRKSN